MTDRGHRHYRRRTATCGTSSTLAPVWSGMHPGMRAVTHERVARAHRQFRWAFLAYLLLPTMLLIVKITVLTWRFEWATEILREALVLFIFVHVGVTFRPVKVLTFADVSWHIGVPVGGCAGSCDVTQCDATICTDCQRKPSCSRAVRMVRAFRRCVC